MSFFKSGQRPTTATFDNTENPTGLTSAPSISFSNDQDTGVYRPSANTLGLVAGGATTVKITPTQIVLSDGTEAAPGLAFDSDRNTGLYRPDAETIAIATNGSKRVQIDADSVDISTNLILDKGTYSVTLNSATATEDYVLSLPPDAGSNNQVLTTNGSGVLSWTSSTSTLPDNTRFTNDSNTGITRTASDTVALTAGGVNSLTAHNDKIVFGQQLLADGGSFTNPGISFDGDEDSGFLHFIDDEINVVTNGVVRLTVSNNSCEVTNELTLSNGSNYVKLDSSLVTTPYTIRFPPTIGTAGQTLSLNGSSALVWTTPSVTDFNAVPAGTGPLDLGLEFNGLGLGMYAPVSDRLVIGIDSFDAVRINPDSMEVNGTVVLNYNGSHPCTLRAGTGGTGPTFLDFPNNSGSSGDVLSTNGSGTLNWTTPLTATTMPDNIRFASDTNTGVTRVGENVVALTAGDINSLQADTTKVVLNRELRVPDGTNAAPGLNFRDENNSGFYRKSAGVIGASANGTNVLDIADDSVTVNTVSFTAPTVTGTNQVSSAILRVGDGSAAAPSISFTNDPDTGIYRANANEMYMVTNGTPKIAISDSITIINNLTLSYLLSSMRLKPSQSMSGTNYFTFPPNEGSVGQVLTRVAGTEGETEWTTPSSATDINGATEDTSPDTSADYVLTYDNSASTNKKVLLKNIKPHVFVDESIIFDADIDMKATVNVLKNPGTSSATYYLAPGYEGQRMTLYVQSGVLGVFTIDTGLYSSSARFEAPNGTAYRYYKVNSLNTGYKYGLIEIIFITFPSSTPRWVVLSEKYDGAFSN